MPNTTERITEDTMKIWGIGLSSIRREILFLCLNDNDYSSIASSKNMSVQEVKRHERLALRRIRKAKKKCPYPKTIKHYPFEWPLELLSIDQKTIKVLHNHDPEIHFVKDFFISKITEFDLRDMSEISGRQKAQLQSALSLLDFGLSKTPTTIKYMYFDDEKRQNLTENEREFMADCYFGKVKKSVVAKEMSHQNRSESTTFDVQDVEDIISSGKAKLCPQ